LSSELRAEASQKISGEVVPSGTRWRTFFDLMRILFVLHDFLPKHPAGTEIFTFEVARELQRRGHEVHIFAAEKDISRSNLSIHHREYEGLPVHELTNNLFYDEFSETWDYPQVVKPFGIFLDDLKPDVVHFMHLLYLSVGCVEEVSRRGIPVIYTLHDYWLQCARYGQRIHSNGAICHEIIPEVCGGCLVDLKFKQTPVERAVAKGIANLNQRTGVNLASSARLVGDLLKGRTKKNDTAQEEEPASNLENTDEARAIAEQIKDRDGVLRERLLPFVYRFLSPSEFLRERFLEWGIPPEQIDFCRVGINLKPFEGVERVPSDTLRVAFIGTPVPHKGVHVLLEAWGKLTETIRSSAQLEIYGGLDHNPGYIRKIQTLSDAVGAPLMGALKRSEVASALARTDLLVVPSIWYENSPLTILEAIATKTPILVSDLGGMAELVEPGLNGYKFKVGDSDDLARVLSDLHENPERLSSLYPDDLFVKPIEADGELFENLYQEALAAINPKSTTPSS
jgi:glycosyltransferase involved in cell wall biosynthesis